MVLGGDDSIIHWVHTLFFVRELEVASKGMKLHDNAQER